MNDKPKARLLVPKKWKQISVSSVPNVRDIQCNYVIVAIDEHGAAYQLRDTDEHWRMLPLILDEEMMTSFFNDTNEYKGEVG